ncbi:hypothetical protein BFJ70_g9447 [Fusarium oxysporum]|uniref:Uncharacterized protein n=1 Tax=Fusarium oxysporum f. sp. cepae TaxID=396571 RepID=A0A3L6P015_FUSOX|nr:hypothetical protein BFJ65_g3396 [Fusarium oxysporum f. sp. cepae]RKK53134.1 hypothetical protein BFJ66_g5275 [Fusarium oxysporum f. sp. cepae]RKK63085.1 hypothetical protein BFJ67_g991 [Fusarium oxysporum f. sp. cepae]RKL31655.1 hypothetical protein BFJ70_g9447 [Fusarium oxysporum]
MFIKTVIILLASLSHGKEIMQRRHDEPGPDRLACPVAIAAWSNLADAEQYIYIPFDQCLSATEGTCRTVACAPTGNLTIKSDEITGRMWNPVSTKCVFGGVGGIWQNDGSTLVIEMGYASQK